MEHFDFEQHGIEGWHSVEGRWGVEDMPGAPSGHRVLVQRATARLARPATGSTTASSRIGGARNHVQTSLIIGYVIHAPQASAASPNSPSRALVVLT